MAIILDPVSEDAANVELDISDSSAGYDLESHAFPAPQQDYVMAGSVDTEGERIASRKHRNREVSITLQVSGSDATELEDRMRALEGKLAKLAREGGTLAWSTNNSVEGVLDVLAMPTYEPTYDHLYYLGHAVRASFTLTCKPYWRGPEETLASHAEATNPILVFTETDIKGDVYAPATLTTTAGSATSRELIWGLESRYYSSHADAWLFMEAEAGGAATGSTVAVAGTSGGNVVRHSSLATTWGSMSFNLYRSAGSGYNRHVGVYRVIVKARSLAASDSDVQVKLWWQLGNGNPGASSNVNAPVTIASAHKGVWYMLDLGLVVIPPPKAGTTQRWGGAVDAIRTGGTVATGAEFDWVALIPVAEGSGRITAGSTYSALTGNDLIVKSDGAEVETASGAYWYAAEYEGDYFFLPPAGPEGRTVRIAVKAMSGELVTTSTNDTLSGGSPSETTVGTITSTVAYRPRYLTLPGV